MTDDVTLLERMIEDLRALRTRTCEPRTNTNPRYLRLSNAVSALSWVAQDLHEERRTDT